VNRPRSARHARRSAPVLRLAALLAAAGVVALGVTKIVPETPAAPPPPAGPVGALLGQVRVVEQRPNPPGYDRDCGPGHGCVFGPRWTDKHNGAGGRNGCDTRNDVLAVKMIDVVLKADTRNCVVQSGILPVEPYTGRADVRWQRGDRHIDIDHLYPLALAWDMGAHAWSKQRRIDFANDQMYNLIPVDATANRDKSDAGPAEWLPVNAGFRCAYVKRFLQVAIMYDLAITADDAESIRHTATGCPTDG
jgi:hypothetical protein